MISNTGNHFLETLSADDREALDRHLRPVDLAEGEVIIAQGAIVDRAIFPIDVQLTNIMRLGDGSCVEVALVGREGLAGLAPLMADQPCGWEVAVRVPGRAFAVPAAEIRSLQRTRPSFLARLLDLTQYYQEQAAQLSACNAVHRLQPRLARWLLTAHDLSTSSSLAFTQEDLASLLGSQRSSVTEAALALRASGAIRYGRGSIEILDRRALQGAACSCYENLRTRARLLKAIS